MCHRYDLSEVRMNATKICYHLSIYIILKQYTTYENCLERKQIRKVVVSLRVPKESTIPTKN